MKHKNQHYIPASYLNAWCDPNIPKGHQPYVWQFSQDGNQIKKKAPRKIFHEKDLYTTYEEDGQRNLSLEYNLSRLEGEFSRIRKKKLSGQLALSSQERMILCMFTVAMYGRTKAYGEHWSQQWGQMLELGERIQGYMENASPEDRARAVSALSTHDPKKEDHLTLEEVRALVDHPIPASLPSLVSEISPMLFRLPMVILEANDDIGFITSDAPCVWYDPAVYENPSPPGAGGLVSPTLEITLPISSRQMLFFGKKLILERVYLPILDQSIIDNLNKRTRVKSYEYFVTKKPFVKLAWF